MGKPPLPKLNKVSNNKIESFLDIAVGILVIACAFALIVAAIKSL